MVHVRDGFADLTPFADTKYTGLPKRGDVFVEVSEKESVEGIRATEIFAQQLGITKKDMDDIIKDRQLVWHHDITFAKDGGIEKVRMVLIPTYVNNTSDGGFAHMGGRAIIKFHQKHNLPLVGGE